MASNKQVSLAGMKVGIFVTIALILFTILILQQSWGFRWFSKEPMAITYLPDVGGLKPGAPVWLAGLEIGRVRKVTIVPPEAYPGNAKIYGQIEKLNQEIAGLDASVPSEQRGIEDLQDQIRNLKEDIRLVEVQLEIRQEYLNRISKDSEVSIESRGLIGDSFINLSPGTAGVLPEKRGEFYIIEGLQRPGFREIMTGANDVVANFGILSDQFKTIVNKINPEKVGTGMADTVKDMQVTIRQANQTFSRASVLIDELHSGKGTIGQIVSDPKLYVRLTESLEKFNSIADTIQSGKGTIGKLINDPALFNSANETLKKAEHVMDRMEKGEGTLGKLSKDEALYERTRDAFERFASLVEEIEQGKGTMGKLLKDPGLYNNLDQSTAEISKFLYDLRKDPKKYLTIRFRLF
jgi:phospholipid/cholesterol/gamma-HCH transport system substrate-binding protein